tara:strand:+ start:2208 stop:3287 length:1080 start_codon:yes stop_codon:yes gene_type:complete
MTNLLFPTTVVGSMPRPNYIQELLNPEIRKTLSEEEFNKRLENAILFVVDLQKQAGVNIISDGEWRRLSYIGVIADLLDGFKRELKDGLWWHTITEELSWKNKGLFSKEAKFVLDNRKTKLKVALPSPFLIGSRMWNETDSKNAYLTREDFMRDLVPFLREEIQKLAKAGVSIVQIDDPHLCLFVDPEYRAKFKDAEKECSFGVELINEVVKGIDDIEIAVHLCRSSGTRNRNLKKGKKTGFVGKGGYDFILPFINQLKVNQLAMEFADPESGDVSVLEHIPNKKIGFGCVDCRPSVFNKSEEIVKNVEKALEYVDKERILLNPDCGFAPGNAAPVSIDQAYDKLKEMVKASNVLKGKY